MSDIERRELLDAARQDTLARLIGQQTEEMRATREKIERDNKAANKELVSIVATYRTDIHRAVANVLIQVMDIKDALAQEQKERPARQRDIDSQLDALSRRQYRSERWLVAITVALVALVLTLMFVFR